MSDGIRSRVTSRADGPLSNDVSSSFSQCQTLPGATFPLSMVVQILAIAIIIFSTVVYLGVMLPPAKRNDLGWWREGPLYELPEMPSIAETREISARGYFGLKTSKSTTKAPNEEDQSIIQQIHDMGLKYVATLDLGYFTLHKQYEDLLDVCFQWLQIGSDGLSLHMDHPTPFVQNISKNILQLAGKYFQNKLVLVAVESNDETTQIEALKGGTHLIKTGLDVCQQKNGNQLAAAIQQSVANIEEGNNQRAVLWKGCSSEYPTSRQLLPFLLPGTALSDPGTLIPEDLHSKIQGMKKWPSLHWGLLDPVMKNDDIFSYVLWAKGKMYDKVFVAINVGEKTSRGNYAQKLDRFTVPLLGRVILSLRKGVQEGQIVEMSALELSPGEIIVIQFPPFGI